MTKNRGMNPLSKAMYGFQTYPRGVSWLFKNKKYLFMVFFPTILGLMAVVSGWSLFFHYQETILDWVMMEKPESWYGIAGYWWLYGVAYVGVLGGVLLACLLMVNVLTCHDDWLESNEPQECIF